MRDDFQHPKQESLIWGRATRQSIKRWQSYVIIFLVISVFTSFAIIGLSSKKSEDPTNDRTSVGNTLPIDTQEAFPIVKKVCSEWKTLLSKAKEKPLSMEEMGTSIQQIDEVAQNSNSRSLREVTNQLRVALDKSDIETFKRTTPRLNNICRKF